MTFSSEASILMRRSLSVPFSAPVWPEGVRLATFSADDAHDVHALFAAGYADGGGSVDGFGDWWGSLSADAEFDPALCFLARDSDARLVGAAQCWTSAFVKDLVVHPTWRRRGIGEALLLHAFACFRQRGAASVDLKVLRDNPSGAFRLYARLGMEVVTG